MRFSHLFLALLIYVVLQWISFKLFTLLSNEPILTKGQHLPNQRQLSPEDEVIVIYNRIPKTGSTSFMHLPYELCEQNHFNVLLLNISNPHSMTFSDRIYFAQNVSHWHEKMPAIYHGHFAFFDVENMGIHTGNAKFIYINVIRQPMER